MKFVKPKGFAPLRYSRFRLLAGGQLASEVGNAFYAIALPWYILRAHGGPVLLGTVLAAYGIARLATLIPGGSAADRWRPWTVMLVTDGAQAVLTGLLAVVAATNRPSLWELLPIAVFMGSANGLFTPGAFAILPSLVPDDTLQAGNALLNGSGQLAGLLGPALGGVFVALVGPAAAFGVDSVSFVISVLSLAAVLVRNPARTSRPATDGQSTTAAPEGSAVETEAPGVWQLLRRERLIQLFLLIVLVANLGSGSLEVAFPVLVRGPFQLGADGYGALMACSAAGGLVGVLVAAHLEPGRRPAVRASVMFLVANVFAAAVPYVGGPIGAGAYLLIEAGMLAIGNMMLVTLLQRWAPPASIGRTMSLLMLASLGAYPISTALAGALIPSLGPGPFYPLSALFCTLAILFALTQAQFRRLGVATDPSDPGPTST